MIDRATVERILDAADIVDVVSEFVTLRKRGVNYVGLCPFHDDKTPSFYVSPSKGVCQCFACGKGGNAVHFVMEHEQITYPEALRWLARKYNIEIKERELTDEERLERGERESMFIVNEATTSSQGSTWASPSRDATPSRRQPSPRATRRNTWSRRASATRRKAAGWSTDTPGG